MLWHSRKIDFSKSLLKRNESKITDPVEVCFYKVDFYVFLSLTSRVSAWFLEIMFQKEQHICSFMTDVTDIAVWEAT